MQERLNETLYRIANAPVRSYPFPHFFVRDAFPRTIYDEMHAQWPRPEEFQSSAQVGNPEKERFYFQFEDNRLKQLSPERRIFWEKIRDWLRGPEIRAIALGKYQPRIDQRLTGLFGPGFDYDKIEDVTSYGLSLVWDISGYALMPHADDPRVIFNFLFYLPRADDTSQFGTSIYLPKRREFISTGQSRHPRHEFEHVATFPFLPNCMFSFLRTPQSFHGVEPVSTDNTERRLLLYSIRIDETKVDADFRSQEAIGLV